MGFGALTSIKKTSLFRSLMMDGGWIIVVKDPGK